MRYRSLDEVRAALPGAAKELRLEIPVGDFEYLNFSEIGFGQSARFLMKPDKFKGKTCGPRSKVMMVINVWRLDDGAWELACNT